MPEDVAATVAPAADEAAEAARAEEAQAQIDFESGMLPEPPAKSPKGEKAAAPDPKPARKAAPEPVEAPPEYVQITRKDWDEVRAAAARTASYDAQFSKAFGTLGGLQKTVTTLQAAPPRTGKIEIPKDAFSAMEKDFPELAQQTRAALEATLRGVAAGGDGDPEAMKKLVAEHVAEAATRARIASELETLDDLHPDWRTIVGKVEMQNGEQPDPTNPFRKWLATKDAAYQARLNSTNSAAVISRAIDRFQAETKPAPATAPSLKAQLQAARIKAAVQPRGDGGPATNARTAEDEFAEGFAS